MDLQPELAIASGLISKSSLSAKIFSFLGNFIIRQSDQIISLDKYMTEHLKQKGARATSICQIPVWPVSESIYRGSRIDNPFRLENGYGNKLVIMYSGNHAFVHPLETILIAIETLKNDDRFLFSFIGGGVRKKEVTKFKHMFKLENIRQHPFQPRSSFHVSIGSSDIQVVIMGQNQVGFTHPNKIYGAMLLGKPILYIGPTPSHISDILNKLPGNMIANHGAAECIVKKLKEFSELSSEEQQAIGIKNREFALRFFDSTQLKSKLADVIEQKDSIY